MISSVIFSKNRPLQLDLCLKSIEQNFKQCCHKTVIHNNSDLYEEAQKTLAAEHPSVDFWRQGKSLFKDVYTAIASSPDEFVCFFTDDIIFHSEFHIRDFDFWNEEVSVVSLRLGENITERSLGDQRQDDRCRIGFLLESHDLIASPKTSYLYGSYWSYNLSVDGHIFKKDHIMEMMDELCLLEDYRRGSSQTPNQLETALQRFWATSPNIIVCPRRSVVVNSPNNKVQETHDRNMAGERYGISPTDLLDKYILGKRINLDSLNFDNINCPHTEIDILKGLE